MRKYDNKPIEIKRPESRDKSPLMKPQDYKSTPLKSRPSSQRIEKTPVIKKKEPDHRILVNPIKIVDNKKPANNFLKAARPGDHGVIKVISNNEQKYLNIYRK
jgi:hypothetical protein